MHLYGPAQMHTCGSTSVPISLPRTVIHSISHLYLHTSAALGLLIRCLEASAAEASAAGQLFGSQPLQTAAQQLISGRQGSPREQLIDWQPTGEPRQRADRWVSSASCPLEQLISGQPPPASQRWGSSHRKRLPRL